MSDGERVQWSAGKFSKSKFCVVVTIGLLLSWTLNDQIESYIELRTQRINNPPFQYTQRMIFDMHQFLISQTHDSRRYIENFPFLFERFDFLLNRKNKSRYFYISKSHQSARKILKACLHILICLFLLFYQLDIVINFN